MTIRRRIAHGYGNSGSQARSRSSLRLARGRDCADLRSAPGNSMAIIGPPAQALAAVAEANGRMLRRTLRHHRPLRRCRLRRRLYAAGALLVLDAEQAGGCSGLPPKGPSRSCSGRGYGNMISNLRHGRARPGIHLRLLQ